MHFGGQNHLRNTMFRIAHKTRNSEHSSHPVKWALLVINCLLPCVLQISLSYLASPSVQAGLHLTMITPVAYPPLLTARPKSTECGCVLWFKEGNVDFCVCFLHFPGILGFNRNNRNASKIINDLIIIPKIKNLSAVYHLTPSGNHFYTEYYPVRHLSAEIVLKWNVFNAQMSSFLWTAWQPGK